MTGPFARLALASALLFAGCTSGRTKPPVAASQPLWSDELYAPASFADPGRRDRVMAALPELDGFLDRQPRERSLPGLSVGVVLDGELVHARGYGRRSEGGAPIDADTVFRVGSLTKTLTSAAVLKLRDEGKLSLDEPAERYLGELGEVVYPTRDSRPFTLRELLTHGSGLPRLGDFDATPTDRETTEQEVLASLPGFSLENAPGSQRVYSNLGYSLLGLVVGRASGVRFRDYVSQGILAPLGMKATVWDATAVPAGQLAQGFAGTPRHAVAPWRLGAGEASGGLYSSVRDLARYASFELSAWPARNDPEQGPVKRASLRESHAMARYASTTSTPSAKKAVDGAIEPVSATVTRGTGLGWQVADDSELGRVVWHNGAVDGYSSALYMLPDRGVAVIALANVFGADMDGIADGALRALVNTARLPVRQLQPSAALSQGASRVAQMVGRGDEGVLEGAFWGAPGDLEQLKGQMSDLGKRFGACRKARPAHVDSGVAGSFVLECERGEIPVKVKVRGGRYAGLVSVRVEDPSAKKAE